MIKRELIINLKGFLICILVLIMMFLMVYLIYPFIITEDTINQMDELMKVFPEELLKAFNMDMASISTAYGWVKTEGLMFILLAFGIYAGVIGTTILLKEENDKTIEYLSFLPVKRRNIVTNKLVVGGVYIVSMTVIFGLFNFVCLLLSGDFDKKEFLLLSISPLLFSLPLFTFTLFLSTFMHKTKKVVGMSVGLVFVFYLLNMFSELSEKVKFFKYFSFYTLADTRNIIESQKLSIVCVIISIGLTIIFALLTYIRYNKKELI